MNPIRQASFVFIRDPSTGHAQILLNGRDIGMQVSGLNVNATSRETTVELVFLNPTVEFREDGLNEEARSYGEGGAEVVLRRVVGGLRK